MNNKVHEKGYKTQPLTEEQKKTNNEKSKIRARVEHVFGFMEKSMNGLINLTYNLFRVVYPERSRREQVIRLNIL